MKTWKHEDMRIWRHENMRIWYEDMKTWGQLCSSPQQGSCASGPHQKLLPFRRRCLDTIQHWFLRNHKEPMNPFIYTARMPPVAMSFLSMSEVFSSQGNPFPSACSFTQGDTHPLLVPVWPCCVSGGYFLPKTCCQAQPEVKLLHEL